MRDKLTKVWKLCETKQLSKIFEEYMISIGAKKYDNRKKDFKNTYLIDGKSTNWNRVQCHYYKDSTKWCEENLLLVLRKRAGDYFIVQSKDERAFEVDYSGERHFNNDLLNSIIEEHKPLFNMLEKIIKVG